MTSIIKELSLFEILYSVKLASVVKGRVIQGELVLVSTVTLSSGVVVSITFSTEVAGSTVTLLSCFTVSVEML